MFSVLCCLHISFTEYTHILRPPANQAPHAHIWETILYMLCSLCHLIFAWTDRQAHTYTHTHTHTHTGWLLQFEVSNLAKGEFCKCNAESLGIFLFLTHSLLLSLSLPLCQSRQYQLLSKRVQNIFDMFIQLWPSSPLRWVFQVFVSSMHV